MSIEAPDFLPGRKIPQDDACRLIASDHQALIAAEIEIAHPIAVTAETAQFLAADIIDQDDFAAARLFGQCNAAWTMNAPDFCFDAVWDMTRVHDLTNHFATAFLTAELYEDEAAAAVLAPDAVQFPGIEYQTTGF